MCSNFGRNNSQFEDRNGNPSKFNSNPLLVRGESSAFQPNVSNDQSGKRSDFRALVVCPAAGRAYFLQTKRASRYMNSTPLNAGCRAACRSNDCMIPVCLSMPIMMSLRIMICIDLMHSSRMPFWNWNLIVSSAALLLQGQIYPAVFNGVLIPGLGL